MVEQGQLTPEHCEPVRKPEVAIRPYADTDCKDVVAMMQQNFKGLTYSLFPRDVVTAYKAANRETDVRHAVYEEGTEAYVAETSDGEIGGFVLIRHNSMQRRNAYGDLDLRRLHVNPNIQGQGIGRKLFDIITDRARALNVEYISGHASGGSRPYFEQNGWTGRTILNKMTKRGTSALVFAAERRIQPESIDLHTPPTHLIYAGTSKRREDFLRSIAGNVVVVKGYPSDESPTTDVVEAARSKAHFLGPLISKSRNNFPLVIASDIRAELLVLDPNNPSARYRLENRGKPQSPDIAHENFIALHRTAEETKKPAPYIVRSATYVHDPFLRRNDSYSEYDVSFWFSEEGLAELSSENGFADYRDELRETYGDDVTDMAAGFALPIFMRRGYIVGVNGYPLADLPKADKIIEKANHTVLVGIEEQTIKKRLGII